MTAMNSILLYQWTEMMDKGFPRMGRWQKRMLARFSYGVVLGQSCRLNSIAKQLTGRANASRMERGLQRFLANDRIVMRIVLQWWISWVIQLWGKAAMLILVDETKLSDHV